jgi:hypothetical protein
MGELDDDDDHEDDEMLENDNDDLTDQSAENSKRLEESKDHDENVRDDDQIGNISRSSATSNQKKNLRDAARKLWLAVEVGDKVAVMKIL